MHNPKMPSEEACGEIVPRPFSSHHNLRRAAQPPRAGHSPGERGGRGRNVRPFNASSAADPTGRPRLPSRAPTADASSLRRRRKQFVSSTESKHSTSAVAPVC